MLRIYNTLTNKKEEFHSLETGKVKMYNCGPTVYDYPHIGNMRAFLTADILRRTLEFEGYEVRQIMNITDVGHLTADDVNQADSGEDKMLKASLREKKSPEEIANFYTKKFFEYMEMMNMEKAHFYPRATAHIPQMIKMIETLLKNGLAYEKNGNVFYDVEKFKGYGKLSGKKLEDLRSGARLEEHPDKKNPFDFALWLKAPKEHLLKWESPWSIGYPGWHIECSAMSIEYLGETMDVHTGGEDHIFPHHENEIAQSEGATGKPFSNYWLHVRFLLVDGKKMSKSKNNFYTIKDIIEKGYDPMAFRLLLLGAHYRSNLNFTWESLDQAKNNLKKITRFLEEISNEKLETKNVRISEDWLKKLDLKFKEAVEDDLNTPLAISYLYELISEVNRKKETGGINEITQKQILKIWEKWNKVFGLKIENDNFEKIPADIEKLAKERENARKNKNFEKADEIRKLLDKQGFAIEDTELGPKIIKQ